MPLSTVLARVCLLGLMFPPLALALPPVDPEVAAAEAKRAERQRMIGDKLLGDVQQDMALLVIPTANLDAQAGRNFNDPAVREAYARQSSVLMHWEHTTEKGFFGITAGPGKHKFSKTDLGPIFQTARGELAYQVIPVWPGEYRLTRITYQLPRTDLPTLDPYLEVLDMKREMAFATVSERVDFDFTTISPWPRYDKDTDDGLGQGCTVVMRLGGGCDEAARALRWQRDAARAVDAGAAEAVVVPGMDVDLSFAPIASITLKKGDVVLTDGFVLPDGQPVMDKDRCGYAEKQRTCGLESLLLRRLPVSIQEFRQAPSAASFDMPKLEAALQGLEYRAPTMLAKPANKATPNVIRAERR